MIVKKNWIKKKLIKKFLEKKEKNLLARNVAISMKSGEKSLIFLQPEKFSKKSENWWKSFFVVIHNTLEWKK